MLKWFASVLIPLFLWPFSVLFGNVCSHCSHYVFDGVRHYVCLLQFMTKCMSIFFFLVLSIDIIFHFLVNNICSVNVITVSIILWRSFYPGWVVSCSGIKHCFNSLTCEEGIAKYKGYQLVNLIFVFFLNSGAWVRALAERKGSFFNKHTQMETQIL